MDRLYGHGHPTGYYTDPLLFYFAAGENTITLEASREPMSIKQIILEPEKEIPTYEEYKAAHTYKQGTDAPIKIEAERPVYQSDESIYPLTDRTSAITSPQDPTVQRLNYMGGNENMKTVGQWVEYNFEVATEGLLYFHRHPQQAERPFRYVHVAHAVPRWRGSV